MRRHRFFLAGLTLGGLLAVTAALARSSTAPAPIDDHEACETLDRAVETLAAERVSWLACDVRQKVDLPGLHYQSQGRYLLAPGHRFRLEVHTHGAGTGGTLLWVGDGCNVWQAASAGGGPWDSVTRLGLREVLALVGGSPAPPRLRAEFLNGPTFGGVGPLLRTLRTHLIWVKQTGRRGGTGEQVELTGVWPPDRLQELAPADSPWPEGLPRQCRVILDGQTLWPHAVEWWGPVADREVLLARTEYHHPVINQPLPDPVCASAFRFDPGDTEVFDRTKQVTADLTIRAQQLRAESAPQKVDSSQ
jgi:hypothetical protein